MSTRITTLREVHQDKTGVVPKVASLMENRWNQCAKFTIIQLEEDGDKYKVTRNQEDTDYQVNHLLNVSQRICSCGIWQGYGIPCADAMIYYK
jgi:hypothetical protein